MTDLTPRQIIEQELPKRFGRKAAVVKRLNAVIVLDIRGARGGRWTLDATKPEASIRAGTDGVTPRMTVVATDADFVAIATGELDAVTAAMKGKLKFEPFDIPLALKLGELLA